MKRRNDNIIILFFVLCSMVILSSGCEKDITIYTPYTDQEQYFAGDINEFFDLAQNDAQSFTINADYPEIITTANGMRIHFEPTPFVTTDNVLVHGEVEIEIVELLTKGDILKYNVPTVTANAALETVVQFNIIAKQNNEKLALIGDTKFRVQFPDNEQFSEVELFEGSTNELGGFIWKETDNDSSISDNVMAAEWMLENNLVIGYESIDIDLGWSAFSAFIEYSSDDITSVCLDLQAQFTQNNTVAFIVYEELNSIIPLYKNVDSKLFCANNLLKNQTVNSIIISHQGNDSFQFGTKEVSISTEMTEEISPNDTAFSDIIAFLNNL